MTESCYEFTRAITRKPAPSIIHGLRAEDIGDPDFEQMILDHADYVATLQQAGAAVTELPALADFPDSVFVEDVALCLPEVAVLMRPGAASRAGEVAQMAPVLRDMFEQVIAIEGPGFIEGGDILATSKEILVGRSGRTDSAGIAELAEIVRHWDYRLREVMTPPGVLHFKTDCSLLDAATILSTPRLDATGCFAGYRVIHTASGEEAAANSIRYNDLVLMPAGFPRTHERLLAAGYEVREINNSECARLDGGMSCLSLRF
ncbi:MAG: dimethylarginine dimethylaminohydrolase [Gammaproteobacteria bacterium]|nr:dimethylarginine dimethylaminohydrolase [Gammaproteobacteria bacterium]